MKNRSKFVFTAVVSALALSACTTTAPEAASPQSAGFAETKGAPYPAADEARYLERFNKLLEASRTGQGLSAYDILEPVEGGAGEPLALADSKDIDQATLDAARAYAAERNSSAYIVWHDGELQDEAYFGEYDKDAMIVSKSMAKPVTALLIGRALKLGYIKSLDQPAADYITEWKDDPQRSQILIRHLLDMRSGMLPQGFSLEPEDILNRAYLHPRHDEVIIHEYPMTHEPGTRYEYSNATSEMIAPIIERATGMRYSQFLSEALLKPIGAAGGSVWVNREGGMAHSGCCLLLPARSWLKLAVLLVKDGEWDGEQLLPDGYVDAMRMPTEQNPYYGMGVWLAGEKYIERRGFQHPDKPRGKVLHSEPYAAKDLFLFDGNSNQVVYMVPSQQLVVLRTGANPPKDKAWDNSKLPNMLIRGIKRADDEPLPEPQAR